MSVYLPDILLQVPRIPVVAVGLPLALGMLSGTPTRDAVKGTWYNSLAFPPGRPPSTVFPFVWSGLYMSMGYASHLAIQAHDSALSPDVQNALSKGLLLYYAQLTLNCAWTSIFFVQNQATDSVLMTGMSLYMTKLFHGPTGGRTTWFLAPYCAWLSYATYINAGVWWLNRSPSTRRGLRKD
ncbi:hypothetical protein EUX98_g1278 [Antrodiella citrinella]|uniref:TspO/MBR-related protein n=1 Tax=Antrodiella citrinella TaxID=2447956 RepID=A0A4S4NAH5_9APHY|nr:hypothetical protein EUX98_g1278 [Antrodiella citrinella]